MQEAQDFLRATLAMNVKTRVKTWTALGDELWRYVLFQRIRLSISTQVALPNTLKGVPHAPVEARPVVEDVCDRLRNDPEVALSLYRAGRNAVEAELNLASDLVWCH